MSTDPIEGDRRIHEGEDPALDRGPEVLRPPLAALVAEYGNLVDPVAADVDGDQVGDAVPRPATADRVLSNVSTI